MVATCYQAFPANGLNREVVGKFCAAHGVEPEQFELVFARHVSVEFAYGEIGYAHADCAMNCLSAYAGIEFSGLPLEIYQEFDAGEYRRAGDSATVIPWQRYTLPAIMEILKREQWLPRVRQ